METISNWIWGSSSSSTPSLSSTGSASRNSPQPGVPVLNAPVFTNRPLSSITAADKEQLLHTFEEYCSSDLEKDAIIALDSPTLKIMRKQIGGEASHLIKFFGILNFPIDLIDYVLNLPHIRKQWDTAMENWEETIISDHKVVYLSVKLPFPLAWRDFVHLRHTYTDEQKRRYVVDISAAPNTLPEKPGYVRARTIFSGLRLTPLGDQKTEYLTVSQVDMAGLIPTTIVNFIATSQCQAWFNSLEQACVKFEPEWREKASLCNKNKE